MSATSATKLIQFFEYGSAGIIKLNRPEARNAMNMDMWINVFELISKMEHRKDLIIFKGSGNVFCAGGDIKVLSRNTPDIANRAYRLASRTYDLIANYQKPYVVLIDGLIMGGAAIFSMSGKYRIATERTAFSMPETAIGYFNDAAASHFLSRLDNNMGIYMGMTGTPVKGFEVKKVGLATHYVESYKLDELEDTLIKCKTHEDVERILNQFSSDPAISTELDRILPNISKCFSGETVEKIYENLHQDGSAWANKTITTLNEKSPTALKVTHRSLTTGRNISLRDCLKMEMRMTIHFCDFCDLKEGVRALLIDKDLKPQWSRKSIYDVSNEDVEKFFQPISEAYELTFEDNLKNKL